ncbi:MAG: hypothetical protein AAFN18_04650 [Cyanobacteria bacterium J06554_6]
MKLLCITDPTTHPWYDTTISLYRTFAKHPGIDFFHAPVSSVDESGAFYGVAVEGSLSDDAFKQLDEPTLSRLKPSQFDLVFCRADDPVPDRFFENLSLLENQVRFVNRPSQIVYTRRKDFLNTYGKTYLPDHIFSKSVAEISAFFERFAPIVAKMNVSYGGKGVYKIWRQDNRILTENVNEGRRDYPSLANALEHLFSLDSGNEYEFVRFLKNIDAGDKRVLVVDGEIYGALLRKATTDSWIHNVTAGAQYHPGDITDRERSVIEQTYHHYHSRGVYTLGYDFLMDDDGEWILSEVNAGNIGGYDWLEEITGAPIIERLTSWLMTFAARAE